MGTKVLSTAFNGTNKLRAYAHCAKKSVRGAHTILFFSLATPSNNLNQPISLNFSGRDHSAPDQSQWQRYKQNLRDERRRTGPECKEGE
jgi:heparanase 1